MTAGPFWICGACGTLHQGEAPVESCRLSSGRIPTVEELAPRYGVPCLERVSGELLVPFCDAYCWSVHVIESELFGVAERVERIRAVHHARRT